MANYEIIATPLSTISPELFLDFIVITPVIDESDVDKGFFIKKPVFQKSRVTQLSPPVCRLYFPNNFDNL